MAEAQSGVSGSSAASPMLGDHGTYHSAEVAVEGLATRYQFKILCTEWAPMCFLVREDSEILHRIREGDVLSVKYYSHEAPYPSDFKKTEIRKIARTEQGPFRGHYMVGFEILHQDG